MNVLSLPVPSFDHHALILQPSRMPPRSGGRITKLHRLEPWWLGYPECKEIIQEQWSGSTGMSPHEILHSLRGLQFILCG